MSTSLSNSTPEAVQAAKNKNVGDTLFDGKTFISERDGDDITLSEVGIEDYYATIQRDVFLKWDKLEQKKAKVRKAREEAKEALFYPDYFDEHFDRIIEALSDYQDDLETAMRVLEFEEDQHANGKR